MSIQLFTKVIGDVIVVNLSKKKKCGKKGTLCIIYELVLDRH